MSQKLSGRLEALETRQFGTPRVAACVRMLFFKDMSKKQLFEFYKVAKKEIKYLTDFELYCLVTLGDRLDPDEAREDLERANKEAQTHSPETWASKQLQSSNSMRLKSLEYFLQSGASVLALPLHWPWYNPYTKKIIGK
jgi:hypothetical protein